MANRSRRRQQLCTCVRQQLFTSVRLSARAVSLRDVCVTSPTPHVHHIKKPIMKLIITRVNSLSVMYEKSSDNGSFIQGVRAWCAENQTTVNTHTKKKIRKKGLFDQLPPRAQAVFLLIFL